MQTLDHDSASIEIEAPAQVVFNLITNIDQMARCSPELVPCRWPDGADRAALGARFEAVNQVSGYRPTCRHRLRTTPKVRDQPHEPFAVRSFGPMASTATATRRS
jgi:hypothetical protein